MLFAESRLLSRMIKTGVRKVIPERQNKFMPNGAEWKRHPEFIVGIVSGASWPQRPSWAQPSWPQYVRLACSGNAATCLPRTDQQPFAIALPVITDERGRKRTVLERLPKTIAIGIWSDHRSAVGAPGLACSAALDGTKVCTAPASRRQAVDCHSRRTLRLLTPSP